MKKNKNKLLKQGMLITSAVLLSVQNIAAVTCTNTTEAAAKTAANAAKDAAKTAAEQAQLDAKAAEDLRDEICKKAAAVLFADSDAGLRAAVAAGAVITIGGIIVVAANSGSSAAASHTASTIDTFNAVDQYYVYHPVANATGLQVIQDLVGLDNLSYLRDVLHASDNLEHMDDFTNEAHSLEERGHEFKQAAFVIKDGKTTYNMTFIDAIGMNATLPQTTYLDSVVKVSGLYLQNTDLDVWASKKLTADALSVKKGTLAVNGTVSVGSFFLDSDATLTGGNNFELNAESNKQIIDYMKDQVPDRYSWADYGKFDLRGTVDAFTAKKGMSVYLAPASKITTLTHSGGTVVLSASTPTQVTNYTVSEASVLSVNWDVATQTAPLLTVTGTSAIGTNLLGVKIANIPTGGLAANATLTVLSSGTLIGDRATYTQTLAGGTFEFKKEDQFLTVTCTKATTSVAGATGLSASLSADILGKSEGQVKGHFAALEIPTAVAALDAAVSDQYLSDVTAAPLSYFSIHQQAYTAGGWNVVDESSESTLISMGVNAGSAKLGFSVSTPSVQTPSAVPTVGAHLLNKAAFMDVTYAGDTHTLGSTLGWQHDAFTFGVSYMYDQRHGVSETNPMGRIEANNINQHRVLCNVGLNKRVETIDLSASLFAELVRFAHGYDVSINTEKFHINGHSFNRHCGLHVQAKAHLATGFISGAFGLSGSGSTIEPTTSVSFNLSY